MAEDSYNVQPKANAEEKDAINFQDLIHICVVNWYWFLLSLIVALGLAVAYIITTPPQYMRQASVLIKDEKYNRSLSSEFGQFSDMGFNIGNTNLYNEIISFKSPSYMKEVVKNLHLDMNYSKEGSFHSEVLYGSSLPVSVAMPDLNPDERASFQLEIADADHVTMTNFLRGDIQVGSPEYSKVLKAKLGTVVQTPVGKLIITPTKSFVGTYDKPIQVYRAPVMDMAEAYAGSLIVELNDDRASVIDIKLTDVSIERADDILNNLFVVYNQKWVEDINKQAISTSNFIDEELRQIENELGNVDEDISSYKSKHLVPDVYVASTIAMNKAERNNTELLDLNNQLLMANYIKRQLVSDGDRFSVLPANSGIDNAQVAMQIRDYNEKVVQRNSLAANSHESNPLVQDLDQQLAATKQAIIASVDNVLVTTRGRISALRSAEGQTRDQIASNPMQAKYILTVERQQKVKEQLYLFLLQKREENQLSKAFTAYNTKLLNTPSGSRRPAKPVKFNIMLVAFVLGLLIPLIILFLNYTFDTKVHTRKDLDALTLPFIGEIPLSYRKRKGLLGLFSKKKEVREIVVKERSGNAVNEAFRVVRTNLEFVTGKDNRCKTIMLTSAYSGSGKTFVSTNLAVSFAIKGKRVLLIDLDLRKGSLSTFVNSPDLGVSDYLSDHVDDVESVMIKGTINPNLDVLPVGTTPPNPTELLYNSKLEEMLTAMLAKYDYIFIDCPPLDIVADASIVNKLCDMTIFVVRSGLFEKADLANLERNYTERRYKNLSVLLNGTYDEYDGYGYHRYGYADNYIKEN